MNAIARLTQQHRDCDDILASAEQAVRSGNWNRARQICQVLNVEIEQHFQLEEDQVFPAFEAATGIDSGPTEMMRCEHNEIRQLLQDMADAVNGEDARAWLGHSETLLILTQQHNMKEENILYPMCSQHIVNFEQLVPSGEYA
ncbi:hemerythrin domain-containing protein [Paludibacterium denitrificans]|uniref:Hemerythrin domain-containing protein n=1 Tax=Paludibacterium denitrificans TaxID=2675226 RepID=A0A844G7L5_9NEIS|nr:hemerythrin domain-containing protein [Paludibacterium denitrificans]MTD32293.1 hemerythrin domain-containing protein [Paludibacterium denitrificans]